MSHLQSAFDGERPEESLVARIESQLIGEWLVLQSQSARDTFDFSWQQTGVVEPLVRPQKRIASNSNLTRGKKPECCRHI